MSRRVGHHRAARGQTWRFPLILTLALAVLTAGGLTAANVVSPSRASDTTTPLSAEDIKPSECEGLTLTERVTGTGVITGTLENDLMEGSSLVDTMSGLAGDDCIQGFDAADIIEGGPGNDVCIGGAGIDIFVGCETEIQ